MGRGASHDGDAAGIELERATEADRARHDLLDRHDLARQHDAAGCGHGDHVGRDRQVVLRHPDEVRAIEREFDAARAARRRGQRLDRREPALLAEADLRVGAAHALRDVDVPVAQADEIAAGAKQFGRPTTAGSAQLRSVRTPGRRVEGLERQVGCSKRVVDATVELRGELPAGLALQREALSVLGAADEGRHRRGLAVVRQQRAREFGDLHALVER